MNSGGMSNSGGVNSGGMNSGETVLAAMKNRYACKRFDPACAVDMDSRRSILEAGRLSPSSFGLEPWLFVVADSHPLKDALYDACFMQENIRTASFVVTIAVRSPRHYACDAEFVGQRAERFPGGLPAFLDEYRGHWEYLDSNGLTGHWARAQGYIACANMMTVAAALGVDSCAIEGHKEDEVRKVLGLDGADWLVSLLIPFGYRDEDVREKIREPYESVVYDLGETGLDQTKRFTLF
jgi:nitroreductase